jgi:hypothetical protein
MNKWIVTMALALAVKNGSAQLRQSFADSSIRDIVSAVSKNYVFPDVAEKAATYILDRQRKGAYKGILSPEDFARVMTLDLQKVTRDLHLGVSYSPEPIPLDTGTESLPPDFEQWLKKIHEENHFGVKEKKILAGNIGYINLTMFGRLELVADTLVAAMQTVAGTDALIIDLRENGGSIDPATIPFFSGYFFRDPVHLNDFYNHPTRDTTQSWSYGWVPGKRYIQKPVYILTSGRTFSGGEEFAYDFKNLKRAMLIGETTRGGANPGGDVRANAHFRVFVPNGRAINPYTKTNWEGVGVSPDSAVRSGIALYHAHRIALEKLVTNAGTQEGSAHWLAALDDLKANPPVFRTISLALPGYPDAREVFVAGSFNNWAPNANRMERKGNQWMVTIDAEPGRHGYKFVVDGLWITDPGNKDKVVENGYTNSLLVVK